MMLLKEMQAFFVSLCFFAVTFFKSDSIAFRKHMKHRTQPLKGFLQNRFYDTLTLK